MNKGFAIIWVYNVKPDAVQAFCKAYGADGDWAQLFAKQKGYLKTTLLEPQAEGAPFATIDFWESEAAFDAFQENFGKEYEALDKTLEDLTITETKIGTFQFEMEKE